MSSTRHSRPGLYWDWCETMLPLWYTFRWWGARGFTWPLAHCEVHLCGGCCSAWPLRLWRRWISYRCLCQNGPIRNQREDCTERHSSDHSKACIKNKTDIHSQRGTRNVFNTSRKWKMEMWLSFSPYWMVNFTDLVLIKKSEAIPDSLLF